MASGKKYGKPNPQTASTDPGASSSPLSSGEVGHVARLVQQRIDAITREIREVVNEVRAESIRKSSQTVLFGESTGFDAIDARINREEKDVRATHDTPRRDE